MLGRAIGRVGADVALDPGSCVTRVFVRGRGVVLEAPSVVALERTEGGARLLAVGEEAARMAGRTPEDITAAWPVRGGRVVDHELAEALLRSTIDAALGGRRIVAPRALVCVPHDLGGLERRAIQDATRSAGARDVRLVSRPLTVALGAGLDPREPVGRLVVDVGGGTTEAAVVALGDVVAARSLPVGGLAFDRAVSAWVQSRHHALVGDRTAEELKRAVGCALPPATPRSARVAARDLRTGVPRELEVDAAQCAAALAAPLAKLVEGLRELLAATTPEIAADVAEHGILLAGGGALLEGLDRYLERRTGLRVRLADDPTRAAVLGAGRLLSEPDALAIA